MLRNVLVLGVGKIKQNHLVLAFVVSLLFTAPVTLYVVTRQATTAPLNYLNICCAWKTVDTTDPINPVPSDITDFVLPDRFFVKKAFAEHQLPLWNPSYFGGEVFLANVQSTVLHPVNIFYLITDELNVQTISVLLSLFLLCFNSILMLGELGRSRLGSAFGGITIAGSTFAIFWSQFGMMTWMMATTPLAIYLFLKWRHTTHNYWLWALSLCLGVEVYFGHTQFSFMTFITLGLFAVYWFFLSIDRKNTTKRSLWLFAVCLFTAVTIAAAQAIPFLEQAKIGHRVGTELTTGIANTSVIRQDLLHFFTPTTFLMENSLYTTGSPFLFSIGLLPALYSCFVLYKVCRQPLKYRDALFFLFLLFFAVLWMWGSLPQQLLGTISSSFKSLNPRYSMSLAVFAVGVVSAYGFDYFYEIMARYKIRKSPSRTIWMALMAVSISMMALYPALILFKHYPRDVLIMYFVGEVALCVFLVSVMAFTASTQVRHAFRLVSLAIVLVNAICIFKLAVPVIPKAAYHAGNPFLSYIVRDSHSANPANTRIVSAFDPQTNLYYGLSTLDGYDSVYAKDIETRIDAINYPDPTFSLTAGKHGSHNYIVVNNKNKPTVLQNLGVQYIIANASDTVKGYQRTFTSVNSDYAVFKSEKSAPQLYFARSTLHLSQSQQLNAIKFATLGYHEMASDLPAAASDRDEGGTVSYNLLVNKIQIKTTSKTRENLFIGQTYRKQWEAYIDGKPATIHRADYNFMALPISSGAHTIQLIYKPASFFYSAILSVTALLIASCLLVFGIGRKR